MTWVRTGACGLRVLVFTMSKSGLDYRMGKHGGDKHLNVQQHTRPLPLSIAIRPCIT
jgi:hypothetical protein